MVRRMMVFGLMSFIVWGCASAPQGAAVQPPQPIAVEVSVAIPTQKASVTPKPPMASPAPTHTPLATTTSSAAPTTLAATQVVLPANTIPPTVSPASTENSVANPPTISVFTADRTELSLGESLTFQWQATGAQVLFCNGLPLPVAPDALCTPVNSTGTLTLVASQARQFEEEVYFALIAASTPAPGAPDSGPVVRSALVVKLKCSICATPTYAPPPLPTPMPASLNTWKTYTNATHGFAFDYPAFYDLTNNCWVNEENDSSGGIMRLGGTISLSIVPANGLELEPFVAQVITGWASDAQRNAAKYWLPSSGQRLGIGVDTSSGYYHLWSAAYFKRDEKIFSFWNEWNTSCIAPEFDLYNPAIFRRIVESFRFVP